ncbi:restriction endonuclease subunit S [Halomontanus rarus]|uniref:restriction endonuclease subunit S n=1 Tax=Halomontanus rarus TaxID=3034020 RepID=UPI0023E8EF90|nr:restriction endonuclease subunit S [Halovivax sp. TS33]
MIETSYDTARLKFLGEIIPGNSPPSSTYNKDGDGVPFIQGSGEFGDEVPIPKKYCTEPSKIAQPSDYLISMRAPVGELNRADQQIGLGRGVAAFRANNSILSNQYAWYALQATIHQLERVSMGSTFKAITASQLGSLVIPLPPTDKQQEIVAFLDHHIFNIDRSIKKKQHLYDLVEEKYQAVIEERFTLGLNAKEDFGTASWTVHLPDKWSLSRGKGLFREVDKRSIDGTETLFSLRKDEGLIPHNEVSDKDIPPSDLVGYKKVKAGQLVMNRMRAATGLVGVAPSDGIVSPDYAIFQTTELADPHFYQMLFQTELFKTLFRSRSNGLGTGSAGFLRLYTDDFLALWFPHPPIEVQKRIITDVSSQLERMNELLEATKQSIQLLQERRNVLIKTTVSGKINVSDWEPPGEKEEAAV